MLLRLILFYKYLTDKNILVAAKASVWTKDYEIKRRNGHRLPSGQQWHERFHSSSMERFHSQELQTRQSVHRRKSQKQHPTKESRPVCKIRMKPVHYRPDKCNFLSRLNAVWVGLSFFVFLFACQNIIC